MYNLGKLLENGTIDYFEQPSFILGDATQYALDNGYMRIINEIGNNPPFIRNEFLVIQIAQPTPITNDDIKKLREDAYRQESDSLFIAYQKYLMLNQPEKAEQSRLNWIQKINDIDTRLPYI